MKRSILLVVLTVLSVASCRRISDEEQLSNFFNSAAELINVDENINKITSMAPNPTFGTSDNESLVDFYTYLLMKDVKIKSSKIIRQDDAVEGESAVSSNLITELKGKDKAEMDILISAPVEDVPACIAAINVLKLYKESKLRINHTIRLVLYQCYKDSLSGLTTFARNSRVKDEKYLFNLDLTSSSEPTEHLFTICEPDQIFEKVMEIVPPRMAAHGSYNYVMGQFLDSTWPIRDSRYSYTLYTKELSKEIGAVTSLVFLLN